MILSFTWDGTGQDKKTAPTDAQKHIVGFGINSDATYSH